MDIRTGWLVDTGVMLLLGAAGTSAGEGDDDGAKNDVGEGMHLEDSLSFASAETGTRPTPGTAAAEDTDSWTMTASREATRVSVDRLERERERERE